MTNHGPVKLNAAMILASYAKVHEVEPLSIMEEYVNHMCERFGDLSLYIDPIEEKGFLGMAFMVWETESGIIISTLGCCHTAVHDDKEWPYTCEFVTSLPLEPKCEDEETCMDQILGLLVSFFKEYTNSEGQASQVNLLFHRDLSEDIYTLFDGNDVFFLGISNPINKSSSVPFQLINVHYLLPKEVKKLGIVIDEKREVVTLNNKDEVLALSKFFNECSEKIGIRTERESIY